MKKLALIVLLTSFTLVSCSNNDDSDSNLSIADNEIITASLSLNNEQTTQWLAQGQLTGQLYLDTLSILEQSIISFSNEPTQDKLKAAQAAFADTFLAWISFEPYVYSPLVGEDKQRKKLLLLINSRQLLPGYLDIIPGYDETGIINDTGNLEYPGTSIDEENLLRLHLAFSDEEATLGFRAIEFLIFGLPDAPRSPRHYLETKNHERRLNYLTLATQLLVKHSNALINTNESTLWQAMTLDQKLDSMNQSWTTRKNLLLANELNQDWDWREHISFWYGKRYFKARWNLLAEENGVVEGWPSNEANRSLYDLLSTKTADSFLN